MQHVYINRQDEREEYSQPPCESIIARDGLIKIGVRIGGQFMTTAEFDAMGERIRLKQTKAFDEMLEKKIWAVDDRTQLKLWSVQ
jgi:hypothetical protein